MTDFRKSIPVSMGICMSRKTTSTSPFSIILSASSALVVLAVFSKNETLFSILKALPMFYVSILLVPIIAFGDYSGLNDINVLFIFILFFVLLFGIIFNWRYGLKNYEAYG